MKSFGAAESAGQSGRESGAGALPGGDSRGDGGRPRPPRTPSTLELLDAARHRIPFWFAVLGVALVIDTVEFIVKRPAPARSSQERPTRLRDSTPMQRRGKGKSAETIAAERAMFFALRVINLNDGRVSRDEIVSYMKRRKVRAADAGLRLAVERKYLQIEDGRFTLTGFAMQDFTTTFENDREREAEREAAEAAEATPAA